MKTLLAYIIFITALLMQPLHAREIIFDLEGVLIQTDTSSSIREFGIANIVRYYYHLKNHDEKFGIALKKKFYEILDDVSTLKMPEAMQSYALAFDEYGHRLPYFMCAWLDGSLSGSEVIAMVMDGISQHDDWFEHPSEKVLVARLTRMLFTPERFVKTRKISQEGIDFIKALKRDGHRVYVLSNWDCASFALLCKDNPKLFKLFDGIVISGDINTLKPDEKAYKALLSAYRLEPKNCIVIDDQKENIAAANLLKMNGILCKTKGGLRNKADFHAVAKDMKNIIKTN